MGLPERSAPHDNLLNLVAPYFNRGNIEKNAVDKRVDLVPIFDSGLGSLLSSHLRLEAPLPAP